METNKYTLQNALRDQVDVTSEREKVVLAILIRLIKYVWVHCDKSTVDVNLATTNIVNKLLEGVHDIGKLYDDTDAALRMMLATLIDSRIQLIAADGGFAVNDMSIGPGVLLHPDVTSVTFPGGTNIVSDSEGRIDLSSSAPDVSKVQPPAGTKTAVYKPKAQRANK